jgi:drug/metabolite transporter (DMT)-like permease
MPIFTALFWQVVVTSLLLLPFAAFVENFKANWVPEFVFSLFWLAVVTSICAYALMFRLIRLSPATRVSSLQYFIPPTTMIIAWLVFSEALSINGFAGLAITSFGFYFMHLGER